MTKNRVSTFEAWMTALDRQLVFLCGMSSADLPDCPYRDWYDDGKTIVAAARKAIRMANSDE